MTAGFLGRKTGRGFYEYEAPGSALVKETGRHARGVAESAASHIHTIGIVGSGTMACGIAEVAAKKGFRVILRARSAERAGEARAAVEASLGKAVSRGKMTDEQMRESLGRIKETSDLGSLSGADIVIEAVAEVLEIKTDLFRQLDAIVPAHAILATTTSSLPVIALAAATQRPEQVVGIHFFNPAPVMQLVEVVKTVRTSEDTADIAFALAKRLSKHPVTCPDRPGFIVNALLFPYINEAIRLMESGYASVEDVDTAMRLGAAHPLGPFALADVIGLDVTEKIISTLYEEFREPFYAPAPLLGHLVRAGYLGRKTGRGFYTY